VWHSRNHFGSLSADLASVESTTEKLVRLPRSSFPISFFEPPEAARRMKWEDWFWRDRASRSVIRPTETSSVGRAHVSVSNPRGESPRQSWSELCNRT
jgi:hypothetical protein